MTKSKLSKASSLFLALALVLSVVIFAGPTIPAQASPAQTLTLELETMTVISGISSRDFTLQAGDEVMQFTRDNVTIPSGGASAGLVTLATYSYTVSGSLSGTILMEDNSIDVYLPLTAAQPLEPPGGQEPLAEVDWFGFTVGKFDFDDGSGNTFSGVIASDYDIDSLGTGHHQGIARGYLVSTEEGGDFSGQKLIGVVAMKYTYDEPSFEILGATITLTRYFADEITSLGTTEFEGDLVEDFQRSIPTLTGDTLVQFTTGNVALPGNDNTGFSGAGVSATITGPLAGTMSSQMNFVRYYDGSVGLAWLAGKFSIIDGSDTISGVMLLEGDTAPGVGYMFALSGGTTTGIYAGKEYFATLSAVVADSVFTASAVFMELSSGITDMPWPMFRHDIRHTGRSPYTGPEAPTELWSFPTGGIIRGSPAIGADGTIYVTSKGEGRRLYAINPDGSEKWSFILGGLPNQGDSSPAIAADGTIYVGSHDGNLYAVNPDGSEKWRFAMPSQGATPAIGTDGTIYVGSNDGNLYAINPDGSEKWRFAGGFFTPPAIGTDGTIYTGCSNNNVYAINPDGSEKWRFDTGYAIYNSSPAIGADGTIYAGGTSSFRLYAINPDGSQKWSFFTGNTIYPSPAIGADGTIYIGNNSSKLFAVNPDGSEKWNFLTGGMVFSSASIGGDGTIHVGSNDGNLYAVNPDGSEKWRFTTGGPVESSPAIGSDGTIYVGSHDGNLYAIHDEVVIFPDSNLEAAIREAISKPEGPIYPADLEGLTSLDASERGITDLTGLEHCTSLTDLWLCENQISDVSPLENLTSLTYLHLSRNQIDDISPISNLTGLTELDLDGNYISDISPLENLTGLTELDLQGNQISDVSPISNLTGLIWMHLGENQVSDISPLSNLTSLGVLWLHENQIGNITPLSGLTSLTYLTLNGNQITNISPLENLTSVTRLHLQYNQISNIEPLVNNLGLAEGDTVDLTNNPLNTASVNVYIPQLVARGVEVLLDEVTFPDSNLEAAIREEIDKPVGPIYTSDLEGLTSLDASGRGITDLTGLEYCTSLTWLDLHENQIGNITPLSNLASLTWLGLGGNHIGNITPLSNLTSLIVLGLGRNQISNISPLSNLTSLTRLWLWDNQISDISPLSNLTSLEVLGLWDNQISDISPLENLTNLGVEWEEIDLDLSGNEISDIEPLVNNPGLSEGDTIDLRDNPLSPTSVNVYIPQLVARGVEVLSDVMPEAPAADFSASPTSGTAPLTVRFTDQSTGGITDWEWDFDSDGRVDSTEQNPSHTYEFAGNYTVSLRVTGPGGEDIRVKSEIIMVKEKAEPKNGGGFDCVCSRVQAKTSPGELLIGWATVGLCWGTGYYLVRRRGRGNRK